MTISREIERERESIVSLCANLVRARSVNPDGDTRAAADVVVAALKARGVTASQFASNPTMPSVVATLDSGRPGRHLVFNVHLDTMPPGDETKWTVPPWELTRRNGRLYGLGMGNMKGAVAAAVTAFGILGRHPVEWSGRATLTAVSDEVVFGDHGAAFLLETMPDLTGDALICGEGAGFGRVALGEKGVLWLEVIATGDPGHSTTVRKDASASARLAAAVSAIDALNGHAVRRPTSLEYVVARDGDTGFVLTANVGVLHAGTFVGQVANTGRAEIDLRLPPGLTADDAEALVKERLAAIPGVGVHRTKGWDANWTDPAARVVRSWEAAVARTGGRPTEYAVRLPASDASRWRAQGVPALCFGPQPGHSAGLDDYAEEDEVLRCAALYTEAALDFLGPGIVS